MNNKEFIAELAHRSGKTVKDTGQLVTAVVDVFAAKLQEGHQLVFGNFGAFEVKKKLERISVNPLTQQRMLVPPKLVVNFKPSAALKEKFK